MDPKGAEEPLGRSKKPKAHSKAHRISDLEEQLQGLQQRLNEKTKLAEGYLERLIRLQAEFDNFRKRTEKEKEEFVRFASENIVESLLDVLENLERAVQAGAGLGRGDSDPLMKGVRMTLEQLNGILHKEGLTAVESVGTPFDSRYHEAVCRVASNEHPENVIVQEYARGYLLNSRTIRPAKVAVSSGKTSS